MITFQDKEIYIFECANELALVKYRADKRRFLMIKNIKNCEEYIGEYYWLKGHCRPLTQIEKLKYL